MQFIDKPGRRRNSGRSEAASRRQDKEDSGAVGKLSRQTHATRGPLFQCSRTLLKRRETEWKTRFHREKPLMVKIERSVRRDAESVVRAGE